MIFENIIFGISTLDYRTQPLKASCYDHFEIYLLYTACKQQYIYDVFENIIFGISTLDYHTQPLKASCYDHFEICLLYTACKQQYIYSKLPL